MFLVSKLFWLVAQPGHLLLAALVAGALLLRIGRQRAGRALVAGTAVAALALTLLPLGAWLLLPLENRFPPPAEPPEPVHGVITLGGAVDQVLTAERGQPALRGEAERLTAFVALARRYPRARLVYAGGSGRLARQSLKETGPARALFASLGLDPGRVVFEDRSRNTYENVRFARDLVTPSPEETWLVVTSALHMPRAVGVFRRVGWPVVPYPVDYTTSREAALRPVLSFRDGLATLEAASHEWLGLVAYRLLGRTDALLPAPR